MLSKAGKISLFSIKSDGFSIIMGDVPIRYYPESTQTSSQFSDANNLTTGVVNLNVTMPKLSRSAETPLTNLGGVFV